ncbi:MAG: DUF503 domain-containing protein [Singulisphaera sp.]
MTVATLRLKLLVADCQTTREKRRLMRAILEKLHRHFNVSVAEGDHDANPSQSDLSVVVVARTRREARETLARVADAVAAHPRAELLSHAILEA